VICCFVAIFFLASVDHQVFDLLNDLISLFARMSSQFPSGDIASMGGHKNSEDSTKKNASQAAHEETDETAAAVSVVVVSHIGHCHSLLVGI
jgi:hypothetical protein